MTQPPVNTVSAGPVADLPEDACRPVGDGAAVIVRHGDSVVAFANRCAHQDSPLAGGWVRDGVLTCPQHFWRYDLADGRLVGGAAGLTCLPVRVEAGEAFVELPEEPAGTLSLRDQLLARARTYDRSTSFEEEYRRPC